MKPRVDQVMRASHLLLALLCLSSSSFAATYYVGTCASQSYATISAAVASVPPNSIINICPGTYPEQVFISQPVTLQGIKSGSAERARIVAPTAVGGAIPWKLVPNPISGELPIAPQIFVSVTSGTVEISNLTIDASAEKTAPGCSTATWATTGIAYLDSSGTIEGDNTFGQGYYSGCGVGILGIAYNSNAVSLVISSNSVQNANLAGIKLEAAPGNAGVKATVTGNSVVQGYGQLSPTAIGIYLFGVTGTIGSNFVGTEGAGTETAVLYGIREIIENDVGPLLISNNTVFGVSSPFAGITVGVPTTSTRTVSGNKIFGFGTGLVVAGTGNAANLKLEGNQIVGNSGGIDLGCVLPTLSGNIVVNASGGVGRVPSGAAPAGVALFNVDKRASGGCH